jgi:hypothetical protein
MWLQRIWCGAPSMLRFPHLIPRNLSPFCVGGPGLVQPPRKVSRAQKQENSLQLSPLRNARRVESATAAARGDRDDSGRHLSKGRAWDSDRVGGQGSGAPLERKAASSKSSSLQDLLARSAKRRVESMSSNAVDSTADAPLLRRSAVDSTADAPLLRRSEAAVRGGLAPVRKSGAEGAGTLTPAVSSAAAVLAGPEAGLKKEVRQACALSALH